MIEQNQHGTVSEPTGDGFCNHDVLSAEFVMPFDVKSGQDTPFGAVHRCTACGIRLLNPMPAPEQIPVHYDLPTYYTHGASHLPLVAPSFADRVIRHLAWRTDQGQPFDVERAVPFPQKDRSAIDIGCGGGALLSQMRDLGLQAFGVDPDAQARGEAEKKGHRVYPGTAEDLPEALRAMRFDVVTITHVLEHCLNPLQALKNARDLLSDEGLLYCEVPNAGSLYFETYHQISEMLDVPRHLFFFDKQHLARLAAAAGLEITGWHHHGLTRHFSADWKAWENSIHDRLVATGITPVCPRRSLSGDLMLLAAGIGKPPEKRYDCIGFLARRTA